MHIRFVSIFEYWIRLIPYYLLLLLLKKLFAKQHLGTDLYLFQDVADVLNNYLTYLILLFLLTDIFRSSTLKLKLHILEKFKTINHFLIVIHVNSFNSLLQR